MIEYTSYEKKIIPYLDGTLSREELAEFEAFVLTHPEFEQKLKIKKDEFNSIKEKIPAASPSLEILESIQTEMRSSIFNLLKEEPQGIIDALRIKWEDWRSH